MEGCSGLRLFQASRPTILAARPAPRNPWNSRKLVLIPRSQMKLNPAWRRILSRLKEASLDARIRRDRHFARPFYHGVWRQFSQRPEIARTQRVHGAQRHSGWLAAAHFRCFIPGVCKRHRLRLDPDSGSKSLAARARSKSDDRSGTNLRGVHCDWRPAARSLVDVVDRKTDLLRLLLAAQSGLRQALLARCAVRFCNAVLVIGAYRGFPRILFRNPRSLGCRRVQIRTTFWDHFFHGRFLRRVFVSRIYAIDVEFGDRLLARGNRFIDTFWCGPSAESWRGVVRRADGRVVRDTRGIRLESHWQYLVPHRNACRVGLGRNVLLFHPRQRFSGARTST